MQPRVRTPVALALAGVVVAAGVALALGLLGRGRTGGGLVPAARPRALPVADYLLEPRGRAPVRVRLEVAATPAERERGLAGRAALPRGTGMAFLFPADVRAAFWMKGTRIPLSIAFVAADGRVVAVREMAPCAADPCPEYAPGGPYRFAVELGAGAFAAAGRAPGDSIRPTDPGGLPAAR